MTEVFLTEAELKRLDALLGLVRAEVIRSIRLHGRFSTTHEAYAVILEELDELWAEVKKKRGGRDEDAFTEARQIAAMAVRYTLDLEN